MISDKHIQTMKIVNESDKIRVTTYCFIWERTTNVSVNNCKVILTPLKPYFSSICKFSLKLLKLSCSNMFFFVKAMILPLRDVPQPFMRKH